MKPQKKKFVWISLIFWWQFSAKTMGQIRKRIRIRFRIRTWQINPNQHRKEHIVVMFIFKIVIGNTFDSTFIISSLHSPLHCFSATSLTFFLSSGEADAPYLYSVSAFLLILTITFLNRYNFKVLCTKWIF